MQDVFWPITGLISHVGVTGRWGLECYVQNTQLALFMRQVETSRTKGKEIQVCMRIQGGCSENLEDLIRCTRCTVIGINKMFFCTVYSLLIMNVGQSLQMSTLNFQSENSYISTGRDWLSCNLAVGIYKMCSGMDSLTAVRAVNGTIPALHTWKFILVLLLDSNSFSKANRLDQYLKTAPSRLVCCRVAGYIISAWDFSLHRFILCTTRRYLQPGKPQPVFIPPPVPLQHNHCCETYSASSKHGQPASIVK